MISRANDDFGQAEPARFAASAFAANGSPSYLYRFSYVANALAAKRTSWPKSSLARAIIAASSANPSGS